MTALASWHERVVMSQQPLTLRASDMPRSTDFQDKAQLEDRAGLQGKTALQDKLAFILRHTRLSPVPHAPEISLHVAEIATELWQKTEDDLGEIGLAPPFWAFAWAGGQGLARHVLDHPELVRGKHVLDFASGSGLVGIAAMKAGALHVTCADIDGYAQVAAQLNASANDVALTSTRLDLVEAEKPLQKSNSSPQNFDAPDIKLQDEPARAWDIVLAGDIFYSQPMALALGSWFTKLRLRGVEVLVGDPGRAYLPATGLELLASHNVPVTRDLEDADFKTVGVYRVA